MRGETLVLAGALYVAFMGILGERAGATNRAVLVASCFTCDLSACWITQSRDWRGRAQCHGMESLVTAEHACIHRVVPVGCCVPRPYAMVCTETEPTARTDLLYLIASYEAGPLLHAPSL